MKKLLLALTLAVGAVSNSFAVDIVEDWTFAKDGSWAPTTGSQDAQKATSPESGIEYTFVGTYQNGGYLFMQGKTYKEPVAYIEFALKYDCSEIILTTSSGCSTNAKSAVNVYAGDEVVTEGLVVNEQSKDYKITIPKGMRAAGTVYKIQSNTTSYNQQFTKFTYVEATSDPVLEADVESLSFATAGIGNSQENTFNIIAENFKGDVSLSVDNDAFEVPASVTPENGIVNVTVKYTGATAGNVTAKLTLSAGALSHEVELIAVTVENDGSLEHPLTVEDVAALNNLWPGTFYVTGKISNLCAVGSGSNGMTTADPFADEDKNNVTANIILENEDGSVLVPVALPSNTEAQQRLNIYDNPDNRGLTVVVKGSLELYYTVAGVKNTEYISGLPEVEVEELEDLAAFIEKADTKTPFYIKSPVTVLYVNDLYMYVTDGTTNLCIYGSFWTYQPGDVIPGGFKGTYFTIADAPVMTGATDFGSVTPGDAPAPVEKAISEITKADLYSYVKLTNVTFTASGSNITFTAVTETEASRATEEEAAATLAGYNTFKVSLPTDDKVAYDVTGIVNTHFNTLELLPIEFTEAVTTGICSIAADDASAPVEFFNLQGQRIANPESGLYIRRQGTNVTKVVIP